MQETKQSALMDSLKIVGMVILACYVCRFWPLVVFFIIYAIVMIVRSMVMSRKQHQAPVMPMLPEPAPAATEQDVVTLAYSLICQRVAAIVTRDYPGACWVWESPNTRQLITEGYDVFILFNRAGGYRRAQVIIKNLQVTGVVYEAIVTPPTQTGPQPSADPDPAPANYKLLAFQWADAHMSSLQERFSEAIEQGLSDLLLTESELPVTESWPDICDELARAGYKTSVLAEGIKINLIGADKNGNSLE